MVNFVLCFKKLDYTTERKARKMVLAHFFTSPITNKNTQKTIENEEKITIHPGRKQRPIHRAFAVEKTSSDIKPVLQVLFCVSQEIFTFSGSRHIFLKFYRFPAHNIVVEISYALVDAIYQPSFQRLPLAAWDKVFT